MCLTAILPPPRQALTWPSRSVAGDKTLKHAPYYGACYASIQLPDWLTNSWIKTQGRLSRDPVGVKPCVAHQEPETHRFPAQFGEGCTRPADWMFHAIRLHGLALFRRKTGDDFRCFIEHLYH